MHVPCRADGCSDRSVSFPVEASRKNVMSHCWTIFLLLITHHEADLFILANLITRLFFELHHSSSRRPVCSCLEPFGPCFLTHCSPSWITPNFHFEFSSPIIFSGLNSLSSLTSRTKKVPHVSSFDSVTSPSDLTVSSPLSTHARKR